MICQAKHWQAASTLMCLILEGEICKEEYLTSGDGSLYNQRAQANYSNLLAFPILSTSHFFIK
jgi:hypothetical protein